MAGYISLSDYDLLLSLMVKSSLKREEEDCEMDELICDYCGREIRDDLEYIETEYGEIYCNEDELLDVLEEQEYFTRKYKEEEE